MIWGWIGEEKYDQIPGLFDEVYEAVRGGQHRLAVMGIRAILENVMVANVGDQGSFAANLDAFSKGGYISLVQRDAMADILDAGHAAMHRSYKPSVADLNTALDIAEGIVSAIYVHAEKAKSVASRVPAIQSHLAADQADHGAPRPGGYSAGGHGFRQHRGVRRLPAEPG